MPRVKKWHILRVELGVRPTLCGKEAKGNRCTDASFVTEKMAGVVCSGCMSEWRDLRIKPAEPNRRKKR